MNFNPPYTSTPNADESLDPENWDQFELVAHQALSEAIELLKSVRSRPTWQPVPPEVRERLSGEQVPHEPTSLQDVYQQIAEDVIPYPTGNIHPRFWGWVMGTGTADGLVANLVSSAMNAHLAGYNQSASIIERQVLSWFLELFGYPATGSGIFVSGGTVANITGVEVARTAKAGFDVRAEGLIGRPQMTLYGSSETHSWVKTCCELLGLGRAAFRSIPVNAAYQLDIRALKATIDADRANGLRPTCVIGNAGTVNTGAIDDLEGLATLCAQEDLWFHIDGALGGLAILSDGLKPLLKGIERSDSIAFDLHKWGYLQYEIGCVLVRNRTIHENAFRSSANYLESIGRGIQPEPLEFAQLGIQLSRGFRAFRAWVALKTHGVKKIGRVIEQNVHHIRYLSNRVDDHSDLERLADAPLNVCCFRFVSPDLDLDELNRINREILWRIQEEGLAVPSGTLLDGQFVIRVANTNHRTQRGDFDLLIEAVVKLGKELSTSTRISAEEY